MNGADIEFIADTSAIIALLRGDVEVERAIGEKIFALTFVSIAELSLGILKSSKREAAWTRVRQLLLDRPVFHPTAFTATIYARIYFDLQRKGTLIPINDIWIAALAIEVDLPILARDAHFSRVAGLKVIDC
jgi:tRNA(fMet)-specific endonuclease VapC